MNLTGLTDHSLYLVMNKIYNGIRGLCRMKSLPVGFNDTRVSPRHGCPALLPNHWARTALLLDKSYSKEQDEIKSKLLRETEVALLLHAAYIALFSFLSPSLFLAKAIGRLLPWRAMRVVSCPLSIALQFVLPFPLCSELCSKTKDSASLFSLCSGNTTSWHSSSVEFFFHNLCSFLFFHTFPWPSGTCLSV